MKSNAFNEFDVLYNAAGGLSLYTLDDIDTQDLGRVRRRQLQRVGHLQRQRRRPLHRRRAPRAHLQEDLRRPDRFADAGQPGRRRRRRRTPTWAGCAEPHRHQVHAETRLRLEAGAGAQPVRHRVARLQGRHVRSAHGPGRQPEQRRLADQAQGRQSGRSHRVRTGPQVEHERRPPADQCRPCSTPTTRTCRSLVRSRPTTPPATSTASPAR